jgi:hypothetical protein
LEYCNQLMNLIYKNLLFQKSLGEKKLFDDFYNKTKKHVERNLRDNWFQFLAYYFF